MRYLSHCESFEFVVKLGPVGVKSCGSTSRSTLIQFFYGILVRRHLQYKLLYLYHPKSKNLPQQP
jgi:hypothetical protein